MVRRGENYTISPQFNLYYEKILLMPTLLIINLSAELLFLLFINIKYLCLTFYDKWFNRTEYDTNTNYYVPMLIIVVELVLVNSYGFWYGYLLFCDNDTIFWVK